MMKWKGIMALLAMLAVTYVQAEGLSPGQAQKFIEISGLGALFDSLPEQVEQQINLDTLVNASSFTSEKAAAGMREATANINVRELAEQYLINTADGEGLTKTIRFLESDLGRLVVQQEMKAAEPDFEANMAAYAQSLAQTPPPAERVALVQGLSQALHVEESMTEMMRSVLFSVIDALEIHNPEAAKIARDELEQQWAMMEPMLAGQLANYATLSSYYTYKDLSDDELRQYIDFLSSDDGQIYWKASIEITTLYIDQLMRELVRVLESDA